MLELPKWSHHCIVDRCVVRLLQKGCEDSSVWALHQCLNLEWLLHQTDFSIWSFCILYPSQFGEIDSTLYIITDVYITPTPNTNTNVYKYLLKNNRYNFTFTNLTKEANSLKQITTIVVSLICGEDRQDGNRMIHYYKTNYCLSEYVPPTNVQTISGSWSQALDHSQW